MKSALRLAAFLPALFIAVSANAADLSGEVGVVSDYRYRGLSLSEGKPALQATLDADLGKGAYASLWFSTIREEGNTHAELEADIGKEFELASNVTLDLSATYYAYPSSPHDSYAEGSAILSATCGALTGKAGASFAPAQRALENVQGIRHGNAYYFLGAEYALPKMPVKLTAQAGYERGPFDEAQQGGKWDWSLGAEGEMHGIRLGVTYVASDVAGARMVGSATVKF